MKIGSMRHQITIQEKSEAADGMGGITETWSKYADVPASIEPLAGREYFSAKQVQSEATHRIRIRYLDGVTPDMRILFGTRVFVIESIINFRERNIEMQIIAREAYG